MIFDRRGHLFETSDAPLGGGAIKRLQYDGDALVADYDANNIMLRRYVHGADGVADDPLAVRLPLPSARGDARGTKAQV